MLLSASLLLLRACLRDEQLPHRLPHRRDELEFPRDVGPVAGRMSVQLAQKAQKIGQRDRLRLFKLEQIDIHRESYGHSAKGQFCRHKLIRSGRCLECVPSRTVMIPMFDCDPYKALPRCMAFKEIRELYRPGSDVPPAKLEGFVEGYSVQQSLDDRLVGIYGDLGQGVFRFTVLRLGYTKCIAQLRAKEVSQIQGDSHLAAMR